MSRPLKLTLLFLANIILVGAVVWLIMGTRGDAPLPGGQVSDLPDVGVAIRPDTPIREGANEITIGPLTAPRLPGWDNRTQALTNYARIEYYRARGGVQSGNVSLARSPMSVARRLRQIAAVPPTLPAPPRVRVVAPGVSRPAAGLVITDARSRTSRAVILFDRRGWAVSVEATAGSAPAALTLARRLATGVRVS